MVPLSNHTQPGSSELIFARTQDAQIAPANTASAAGSSATSSSTSSSPTTESFANQLASALEGYLSQSGNGSQFEVSVQNGEITISNLNTAGGTAGSGSTTAGTTTATAASTTVSSSPTTSAAATTANASTTTTSSATASTTGTTLTAAQLAQMTPDEAYWAEQPPAVQALQNMPIEDRAAAAQTLAEQGYAIDVPIMVWGQDPLTTMIIREQDGYTWVPSAMQPNCQLPPGLSFPGLQGYDASNPPAGSIPVTTAFANGTNGQDPWVQWPPASTSNSSSS